jgi:tungstate transport system ATP-binding protein
MPFDTADTPERATGSHVLPLRLSGVSFAAGGRTLIEGLDLELHHGPKTVIVGPNGAGKSLTLRLMHGLIQPTRGTVAWAGAVPSRYGRLRQAMVFQQPVLLRRSVAGNIRFVLRLHGVPRAERAARVAEALAHAGLDHLAGRSARVLSGGEQQRLAIARARAVRPEVLFLDEPSSNLDPAGAAAVERMIDEIHAAGTKIVMTTHDMAQVRRLADEVVFMHRGRLIERTPAETFFAEPQSREARAFGAGRLLV